jgi:hypothetical protein
MDPQKAWTRYFITEVGKDVIRRARLNRDTRTQGQMLNFIGKHKLTDKEDVQKPPYEDIVPFNTLPTFDVTVLGIQPIDDLEKVKAAYIKKFGIEKSKYIMERKVNLENVEDANIIEDE